MICIVIVGPTIADAHQQIYKALGKADLVELRLDCFSDLCFAALKALRLNFSIPMIFTLRAKSQGGNYKETEEKRLVDIRALLKLKPEYLDLEYFVDPDFIEEISSEFPEIKLILSYHNFIETPEDLKKIYDKLHKHKAYFYKIAVTPKNSLDTLRLMCWKKKLNDRWIAISMGLQGQISRILAPCIGSPITYACLDESQKTAPGQISAQTLIDQYHYRSLTPMSAIYGLIGDPIDKSISEITHNKAFETCGLNAVYVKIQIRPKELEAFFKYAKELSFQGLSVTMPLKEHVLNFIDIVDEQASSIGAVNTLVLQDNKILGFNTDALGGLNAIEQVCKVMNKRLTIVGAGGASKALAHEALKRGAFVTIVNRDKEKALHLAKLLNCKGTGLEDFAKSYNDSYDILINCTPAALPIPPEAILPHTFVMDITTKPKETKFLKIAGEKNCRIIYGYKMFIEQAALQFKLWFNSETHEYKKHFEDKAEECVSEKG